MHAEQGRRTKEEVAGTLFPAWGAWVEDEEEDEDERSWGYTGKNTYRSKNSSATT